MPNPHDHPTALSDLQDSIYREKVLRARAMTREERFLAGFELTNEVSNRILGGVMRRMGIKDEKRAWPQVKLRMKRLQVAKDHGFYALGKPAS